MILLFLLLLSPGRHLALAFRIIVLLKALDEELFGEIRMPAVATHGFLDNFMAVLVLDGRPLTQHVRYVLWRQIDSTSLLTTDATMVPAFLQLGGRSFRSLTPICLERTD